MDSQEAGARGSLKRRAFAILMAFAVAIGLLAMGILLTSSFGASRVSANARALHWTNATIGSAGIGRASVAQAVFFAFDERLGVSSAEAKDAAIAEARRNLEPVGFLMESPDRAEESSILENLQTFVATAAEVIDKADSGQPDAAEEQRLAVLEPAFTQVESDLKDRQSTLAQSIIESEESAGRIALITEVAITFLIPALTMFIFWWFVRRRMKARESEMASRLESERQMSLAKDEFISGLSHELRTPLTTIHGFSEVLLEAGALDPESNEMLGIINSGSAELSRMVDDLIAAARIDEGSLSWKSELIDLRTQVDAVVGPYIRAGDLVEVNVPPIEVYADGVHLRQIVHNLVSNARRHGGDHIVISGRVAGGKATLVVLDDGPGISEDAQEHLFQRFVHEGREAMVAGSIGLGLAVSKELAMRMGGTLTHKRVGKWTTFSVALPHYPERDPEIPLDEASSTAVELMVS